MDLIDKRLDILENADDVFYEEVSKFENSFYKAALALLRKFKVNNGIIDSKANKSKISRLGKDIKEIISKSTLGVKVKEFLKNFDELQELNIAINKGLSNIDIDEKINLSEIKKEFIQQIEFNLLNAKALEANIGIPIRRILRRAATSGMKLKDAELELRNHIKGEIVNGNQRASQIERYIKTYAIESLNQYDGTIQQEIGNEYDFDGIQIVGSLIATSEAQCVDMVRGQGLVEKYHIRNGKYLKKDLSKITKLLRDNSGNGSKPYKGVSPNLSENNITVIRNHIGCRHAYYFIKLTSRDKAIAKSKGLL